MLSLAMPSPKGQALYYCVLTGWMSRISVVSLSKKHVHCFLDQQTLVAAFSTSRPENSSNSSRTLETPVNRGGKFRRGIR